MKKHLFWLASLALVLNACAEGGSDDNNTTSACAENSKQCSADGIPELCTKGEWIKQNACAEGFKCLAGDCKDKNTKECDNGGKGCSDQGVPQVCEGETWKNLDACEDGKHCVKGNCVSTNVKECRENDVQCNSDGVPEKCQNGKWVKQQNCESGKKCKDGDCVHEAVPECKRTGDRQCSVDGLPQICDNNKWKSLKACEDGERCNRKTGECEEISECSDAACKAMSADEYMGNICVDGPDGKECGCNSEGDCNKGYTCNPILGICAKDDSGSDSSAVCRGYAGKHTCDGEYEVSCSTSGVELSRERCSTQTGSAYKGETCIVKSGDEGVSCGCNSNSNCKSGYECNSNKICTPKACDAGTCAKQAGSKYTGNICVESNVEGQEKCGCNEDKDCKEGYKCNKDLLRCQEKDPVGPQSVCKNVADGSYVCQNSEWIYCEKGQESTRVACKDMTTNYVGNICADKTGSCGCEDDDDCKTGYTCNDLSRCIPVSCQEAECKKQLGNAYKGDACVDDYAGHGVKTCGCNTNADCKTGYVCHEVMGICYKPSSTEDPTDVCDGKNDEMLCSGRDVVFCDDNEESYRISCPDQDKGYNGDACLSDYDFCGCNSDTDCRVGYICDKNHTCVPSTCSDATCKSQTTDYMGNVCVAGWFEGTSLCGCADDDDCNGGLSCNKSWNQCTSFVGSPLCQGKGEDYYESVCDGEILIECLHGNEISRSKCRDASDESYYGNACIKESYGDVCGCRKNTDCKRGYQCNEGVCEKRDCNATECAAATGDVYQGNVCITSGNTGNKYCGCNGNTDCKGGYTCDQTDKSCKKLECYAPECAAAGDGSYLGNACVTGTYDDHQMCGCSGNTDCKEGYECDVLRKMCKVIPPTTVCTGKPDGKICDGTSLVTCQNSQITETVSCKAGAGTSQSNFVGSACIDGKGVCGCTTDADCKLSGASLICDKDRNVCVKACKNTQCKNQTGVSYQGNICVGTGYEKSCGCTRNSDCKKKYLCDNDNNVCVKSSCSDVTCQAKQGDDYKGSVCLKTGTGADPFQCGCSDNAGCREGYTCNLSTMACEKLPAPTICDGISDGNVCKDPETLVVCKDGAVLGENKCPFGLECDNGICVGAECNDNTKCASGYTCNLSTNRCEKAEATNPCQGVETGAICDNNELIHCDNGNVIHRENCADGNRSGHVCISNDNNSYCGCVYDKDCNLGYKCYLKDMAYSYCIVDEFNLIGFTGALDCGSIQYSNEDFEYCDDKDASGVITLEDDESGHVVEIYADDSVSQQFSLSISSDSIKISNLSPGAVAQIEWGFPDKLTLTDTVKKTNQLKISDGKSTRKVYYIQSNGRATATILDNGELELSHAGSSTDPILIKSIVIK